MERITNVWFKDGRICIRTEKGDEFSRPLEAFPVLKEASSEQLSHYEIGLLGDDIRWDELDEDIHISSFKETTEPEPDNEIAAIFLRFPWLNVSEVAKVIGINKSLLSRYIYGIKKPSEQRKKLIFETLRNMGNDLASV